MLVNKSRTRGRAKLAVVLPLRPMTVTALSIDHFSAICFVEGLMSSKLSLIYVISIRSARRSCSQILHISVSSLIDTNPPGLNALSDPIQSDNNLPNP
jgi:hypothetical protein